MNRWLVVASVLVFSGCSSKTDDAAANGCGAGFAANGSACVPQFDTCPDDQIPTFGGGCATIGATCGEGFASDGKGGCTPTMPVDDCEDGKSAVPGDASCRPVDDCGTGTFGDIPDDPGTVYVDQAAPAGGDGTRAKPYQNVSDALTPGTLTVAIAAGSYKTNVSIERSVTLRGRCASMVSLEGAADLTSVQTVQIVADSVTVRDVSITGPYIAVGAYSGTTTIDHVRIHDTGFNAVEALSYASATKLAIHDSVIERGTQIGVLVAGVDATIDRTVVRATQMNGTKGGVGIVVRPRMDAASSTNHTASLVIKQSVVSKNRVNGILVAGSTLDADSVVVRGTRQDDTKSGGPGIAVQTMNGGSKATVRRSVLVDNQRTQLSVIGGEAVVENTVAANGALEPSGINGGGFFFGGGAVWSLSDSVSEKNKTFGVAAEQGTGTLSRVLVRDVGVDGAGTGLGVQVAFDQTSKAPGTVTLERVRIDRCPQVGLLVFGAEAHASELAVFDIMPLGGTSASSFGDGVAVTTAGTTAAPQPGRLTLEKSLVERAARAAVTVFGADLVLRSSQLACSPLDVALEADFATLGNRRDPSLDADDSSACGCGAPSSCHAQSVNLTPVVR